MRRRRTRWQVATPTYGYDDKSVKRDGRRLDKDEQSHLSPSDAQPELTNSDLLRPLERDGSE